ncbi:MAG: rod shape-determining protein MreC [Kiritimatiellales bacterium]|nr:rod shape-determining protein MreC [Kiritimatiellota bacterium]MBL7011984.1 rod shape-determining protein MreC [Kiritimatiellales bacterium]
MVGQKTVLKWIAAACALLLIFLLPDGCTARVKGVFKNLITPVQSGMLKTGRSLKAGADSVRGFGGLAEENRRLYEEVVKLQAESRLNKNIEAENLKLRQALAFHERQTKMLIPAEVAARSISGWWQSVRLAKGTRDGVLNNRAVISPDGLIGRTAEVSARTAEVLLLSDPACSVSARISRTGSFGLVTGQGVNLKGYPIARMRFIHKDTPIRVGDEVVTSGLGGVFPRDVIIGYIESISTEEAGLYQVADILPQAVINLTDVVFVSADDGGAE